MSDPLRKRLLDKTFRYVKAGDTDVAATFRRIRKQLKEQAEQEAAKPAENVKPLRSAKKAAP